MRPTGIHEVEGTLLVAHIVGSGLHDAAVKACFESTLLASGLQQVMDRSHWVADFPFTHFGAFRLPDFSTFVAVDFGEQAIREDI